MKNRHGSACGSVLLRYLQALGYRRLNLGRSLHRLCLTLGHLLGRALHRLSLTLRHRLSLALRHLLNRTLHRLCGTLELQRHGLALTLRHLLDRTLHRLALILWHLLSLRLQRLALTLHCACRALLVHGSSYIFGSGHTLRRRLISGETGRLRTLTLKGSLMLYSPYDCSIS